MSGEIMELETGETSRAKPPVIAEVDSIRKAYDDWATKEQARQSRFAESSKPGNIIEGDDHLPIPKSEEAAKWDKLFDVGDAAKKACGNALRRADPDRTELDALIPSLMDSSPVTAERLIQAAGVIKGAAGLEGSAELAGRVLAKYPDALHLPDVQKALTKLADGLMEKKNGLMDAAEAGQGEEHYATQLLELATSKDSPVEGDPRTGLENARDLLDGARLGVLANKNVKDGIRLNDGNMSFVTKNFGADLLKKRDLESALLTYHELLEKMEIPGRGNVDISFGNLGEAIAALSRVTNDEGEKRKLQFMALGYATAIKPVERGEKAGSVVMALMLDKDDPEMSVVGKFMGGDQADPFLKQASRVYKESVQYSDKDTDGIFDKQNRLALKARDARVAETQAKAAETARKAAEEVQKIAAAAETQRQAEEAKVAVVETPPVVAPVPEKKSGGGLRSFFQKWMSR